MNTNPSNWLTAVNNVISYDDEFSNSHDGFHNVFTIHLLFLSLDPMLESGGMRGRFGHNAIIISFELKSGHHCPVFNQKSASLHMRFNE